MSEAVQIALITGAFTFAGLALNAYFTFKTARLAKQTNDTLRAAVVEAPRSLMGERRVVLRTTRADGVTPT